MRTKTKITAAVLGASLALASSAVAASPNLSTVASKLTGESVTVVRGIPRSTGADADTNTATNLVTLKPKIWNALGAPYTYTRTPWAVATFAHELGHVVRGMSEQDANCYARANLYRVSRALGYGPNQSKVITYWAKQDSATFCP